MSAVVVDTAARSLTRAGGPSIVTAALLARIVTLGARIDRALQGRKGRKCGKS